MNQSKLEVITCRWSSGSNDTYQLTLGSSARFSFECRKVIGFAFTTLRDWLKRFAPLFHPIRSKPKPIVSLLPALCVSYMQLLRVLIGSLYCLCSLWLARVITLVLVLVLRHSNENRSIDISVNTGFQRPVVGFWSKMADEEGRKF